MQRATRIWLFIVPTVVLIGAFLFIGGTEVLSDVPSIVTLTALITATLVALLVEHFFSTPSAVLVTAVSGVLLLLPSYAELQELGIVYWIVLAWCFVLTGVSSAALLLLPSRDARGAKADRSRVLSGRLRRISVTYGSARLVFGLIAVSTALTYLIDKPLLVGVVFVYVVLLVGLDTRQGLGLSGGNSEPVVGVVSGVEPNGVVRVRASGFADLVQGANVSYVLQGDPESIKRLGVIAQVYATLEGPEAVVLEGSKSTRALGEPPEAGDVLVESKESQVVDIGLVGDDSHISVIKVKTLGLKALQEGTLLSARSGEEDKARDVIYQIVDATVRSSDSRGVTIAEAVQLGIWSEESCGFVRHGWVPAVNTLVHPVEGTCATAMPDDSILLGVLPDTEYPVSLDRAALRGTHIAILGVTGCGKSVTSRYLLKELSADDSRVIVIDLTGEYRRLLNDPSPNPIVSEGVRDALISSVEKLTKQMAEFANRRDHNVIAGCEKDLDTGFRKSLEDWIEADDGTYALLELPSFENTATSLEYTRWFLRTLFDIARSDGLGGKSVTVVLEEAHTVVPEWNFAGARGDKSAEGLLNSIAQIALQGRKHGIGFIIVAQRTANVSKTVLTQCSSVVAFRSYDNTSAEFLSNYLGDELAKALPNLPDRHAIVVGSAFHSQVPLICRVLEIEETEEPSPSEEPEPSRSTEDLSGSTVEGAVAEESDEEIPF